jgi:hypothetical protein
MTVGFPDWQDAPNTTGIPIINNAAFSLSAATPAAASGYISNYPSARIRIAPTGAAQGCTVTVTYYADSTLATVMGSYTWTLAAPSVLSVIVPNLGNFISLSVTTVTVAAFNCAIQLTPYIAVPESQRYPFVGNAILINNQVVAISGSFSALMPAVAEGPGYWFINPHDATGKLNFALWTTGQGGGQTILVDLNNGAVAPFNRTFLGDKATIGLFVTNTDGTATHAFDARVAIDGR